MTAGNTAITFSGRVRDGFGIALWQADGSGPEPAAVGHSFITAIEPITAHYYIASREYIDSSARGVVSADALIGHWPRLTQALAAAGRRVADFVMRLPLTTAGADREGHDWFFREGVETRYLRPQGALPFALGTDPFVEFAPPRLELTEDYRGARDFSDVRISLVSDATPVRLASGAIRGRYAAVAQAFLDDLAGRSVRFVVDRIELVAETFAGHGRLVGRFAEIPTARVEVV
ncbi:MAG: hypothetical protein ACJ8KO_04560 [Sulfurifustaceae bacterium]